MHFQWASDDRWSQHGMVYVGEKKNVTLTKRIVVVEHIFMSTSTENFTHEM